MARFYTPSRISENIRETPEGFLVCIGVPIARTGWQEYGPGETPLEVGEEGTINIYRDAKEVFRPQTIASFQGKSVTVRHPNDFVAPSNWKILTNGIVQNPRKGDEEDEDGNEQLVGDLLIMDDFTIGLVKGGLREVSCGYDAEYEQTGDGEGRQFNIIGNHVALVEAGRAGTSYAIKDHKGNGDAEMKALKALQEQLAKLGKTVDKAIEDSEEKPAPKKKIAKVEDAEENGETTYDDVMKAVKDLSDKIDGMGKAKDEEEEAPAPKKKEAKKADDAEEEESEDEETEMGARLDKLEAAVAKILEAMGNEGAEDADEEESEDDDISGESDDEDMEAEDAEESEDEEGEEAEESQKKKKTGDAARFEILTPGKKYEGDKARLKCLTAFAKTEDGKKVLATLGHKKPTLDAKADINTLFLAASAMVKTKRGVGLDAQRHSDRARKYTADDVDNTSSDSMTAEKMNEMNAKHYSGSAK